MKTKLLRKLRKEFKIYYREEPYKIDWSLIDEEKRIKKILYNYKLEYKNFVSRFLFPFIKVKETDVNYFKCKEDCLNKILFDLKYMYPNLGKYNRERILRKKETKIWYNG